MSRDPGETYEFGKFRLDVGERRLERLDGLPDETLPEKAFRTLIHLVRNRGALVTKEKLLAAVWPDAVVEENNLGKAVHLIRRVLGEAKGTPKFIETVPKHGYRFVADVKRVEVGENSSGGDQETSRVFPSRSPAYDLYIRGKVKAGSENSVDTDDAIKVLETAVAIDPYYAPAYAQLARAYNTRSFKFTSSSEAKLLQENADVAIAKALDLDPNLPEAYFSLGLILWTKTKGFPHEQAIKSFRRALELKPDADETHHQLSMVYAHVGLLDNAHEHVAKAIDLNPNNTMARFRSAVYLAWHCRFDQALAVLKTVPNDVSPMLIDRIRAEVLIQLGRLDDAQSIVENYLNKHPIDEGGSLTSVNAVLLAKAGKEKKAERTIGRAIEIGKEFGHFHHTAHNIAAAYAAMQKVDESVKWLEAAADDGFPNYTYFKADPNLLNVREHPGFVALLRRLQQQSIRFKQLA
jgi:DNA-binding winged helix-turn-helix (wHTH) protein/tetratricopeptide (TPR) repeat protein